MTVATQANSALQFEFPFKARLSVRVGDQGRRNRFRRFLPMDRHRRVTHRHLRHGRHALLQERNQAAFQSGLNHHPHWCQPVG